MTANRKEINLQTSVTDQFTGWCARFVPFHKTEIVQQIETSTHKQPFCRFIQNE